MVGCIGRWFKVQSRWLLTMKRQQASRRLTPAPEFLASALDQLRLVPADFSLPSLGAARIQLQDWYNAQRPGPQATKRERAASLHRRLVRPFDSAPLDVMKEKSVAESVFATLPDNFRRYLHSKAKSPSDELNLVLMVIAYEDFRWLRETLKQIARIDLELSNLDPAEGLRFRINETIAAVTWIGLDAEGRLDPYLHPFWSGLRGIQAARIRECGKPKCKQLFWAGRIDQVGCSPQCSQAIRDRKYSEASGKRKQRLSELEKMARVREALKQGSATRARLSKVTEISIGQIGDLLAYLTDDGEVKSRTVGDDREFYLKSSAKKGK